MNDSPYRHLKHSQTHAQFENTCYFGGMYSGEAVLEVWRAGGKGENGNLHMWESK